MRAVLIEMLTNDNKEDEDIEDDDKEDDDVHQLITQQRRRMKRYYVSIAAVLGSRNRFKPTVLHQTIDRRF